MFIHSKTSVVLLCARHQDIVGNKTDMSKTSWGWASIRKDKETNRNKQQGNLFSLGVKGGFLKDMIFKTKGRHRSQPGKSEAAEGECVGIRHILKVCCPENSRLEEQKEAL